MNNWLHSAHVSNQQPRQEPKYSNTSTDVEKTAGGRKAPCRPGKHLHGRGEDGCCRSLYGSSSGNTSTDVEKTHLGSPQVPGFRKHLHGRGEDRQKLHNPSGLRKPLHGRGEDGASLDAIEDALETPPRTWRRLSQAFTKALPVRNTSTDVEKTPYKHKVMTDTGKHLHGRGEDVPMALLAHSSQETPPRTWRRRKVVTRNGSCYRNTSTDVEKTSQKVQHRISAEKHLHGRGEDQRRFDGRI